MSEVVAAGMMMMGVRDPSMKVTRKALKSQVLTVQADTTECMVRCDLLWSEVMYLSSDLVEVGLVKLEGKDKYETFSTQ